MPAMQNAANPRKIIPTIAGIVQCSEEKSATGHRHCESGLWLRTCHGPTGLIVRHESAPGRLTHTNPGVTFRCNNPGRLVPYYFFLWTDVRLEKLENNGICPDDFERIVMNPDSRAISRMSGRLLAFGRDQSGDEIACVYELDQDGTTVYPITAYCTGN